MREYAIALALALIATPASAAANLWCADREDVLDQLNDRYKEVPSAAGLASNGMVIEVVATPDGATWSIIMTNPKGVSCLLATGEGWQTRVAPAIGDGI